MKILLLTSIYPAKDLNSEFTPVVHSFVKEWKKKGHEVIVIHNLTIFPKIYYSIVIFFSNFFSSFFGGPVQTNFIADNLEYLLDDVKVKRFNLFKYIPHSKISSFRLINHKDRIIKYIKKENFIPDVIIGHWINPQLDLLDLLKNDLNCKTCCVIHENYKTLKIWNKKKYILKFKQLDYIGFRSQRIKSDFIKIFNIRNGNFMCYSGIKESALNEVHEFNEDCLNIIFVGMLLKRKHPDKILPAILKCEISNFKVDFVGDGLLKNSILDFARKNNISSKILLHGRKCHDDVLDLMEKSDCFIMISENETFGLVYIEAMAKGCIVVASKNEGFDGIIIDGYNGFLCAAGDYMELSIILNKIYNLSSKERAAISYNAIMTAKNFTEKKVADNYIKMISKD